MIPASYYDDQNLAKDWARIFAEVNGEQAPVVTWGRGWFSIELKKYRRKQFIAMRDELYRRQKDIKK